VDDHLIQLTWKEQQAFTYDLDTFKQTGELSYLGEGWGLCYDGEQIWMSNGSDTLVTRDPQTFEITRQVQLKFQGYTLGQVNTSSGVPLSSIFSQVNELECVGDSIYANVWLTDFILRIDAASGEITGIIDASSLLTTEERSQLSNGAVLNGIAYNPDSETFYITGKDWPKLFEVTFNVVDTISMGG
jgi:glutamine cyclotransferase